MPAAGGSGTTTTTVEQLLIDLAPAVPEGAQRADLLRRLLVADQAFSAKRFIAEEVAGAVQI